MGGGGGGVRPKGPGVQGYRWVILGYGSDSKGMSRGRDRVVLVHGAQMVQERVMMGDAHRVRYGGFRVWHGASDGEAQVGRP